MNKLLLSLFSVVLAFTHLLSQDTLTKDFELVLPKFKVANSLYNTIKYIDSREDTVQIGLVQLGALRNFDAKLICKTPFSVQMVSVFNALTDETAKNGELVFQLNKFNFVENYETRFCYFRANIYSKQGVEYKQIASIDTVIVIRSQSVGNILIKVISQIITGTVANALTTESTDSSSYTMQEIYKIDSIKKSKIPVYYAAKYTDGLYLSYKSFMNQTPDEQAFVDMRRDNSISSVKITDSSGQKVKVKLKNVYAVVYKGQPFIATLYNYYPLEKLDDDFYFTGDINIPASSSDISSAGFEFGLTGSLIASIGKKRTYYMKIDYMYGSFIHLRKIPTPDLE